MHNEVSSDNVTDVKSPQESSGALAEYLKPFIRDMPLAACQELLTFQESRIEREIREGVNDDDLSADSFYSRRGIGQAVRNCLDAIGMTIKEEGPDVTLGDMPDYDEAGMVKIFMAILKGWQG